MCERFHSYYTADITEYEAQLKLPTCHGQHINHTFSLLAEWILIRLIHIAVFQSA